MNAEDPAAVPREIVVHPAAVDPFAEVIGPARQAGLVQGLERAAEAVGGGRVVHVNSAAAGGGVAEILQRLLGYTAGAGIGSRWFVIAGDDRFFRDTKALHHLLHASDPPGGGPAPGAAEHYDEVCRRNAERLAAEVGPGDVVVLHDPQVAGLAATLRAAGAVVVWRCHVGSDRFDHRTERAWGFLAPHLEAVDHLVFSRPAYVPPSLAGRPVSVIPPSIDPFSPKNAELDGPVVRAVLEAAGILAGGGDGVRPEFARQDGSVGTVARRAELVGGGGPVPAAAPLVVQVSRWDALKDMAGVMEGFAGTDLAGHGAHLVLAGPQVAGVADDPEGQQVLDDCRRRWCRLPAGARARVHLAVLPTEDGEENAVMVNALQRHAAVVAQKSRAEGFGLTVAEALWKARPVVASAVGGIVDQIDDARSGLLLDDPSDLAGFGRLLERVLGDAALAAAMGAAGRARARDRFLDSRQLLDHAVLLTELVGVGRRGARRPA